MEPLVCKHGHDLSVYGFKTRQQSGNRCQKCSHEARARHTERKRAKEAMPFRKKKYRQGHDLDPNVVDWRGHQWCLACEEGGLLKRGRQRTQKPNKHGPRTHCQNNHEYTPENTQITKDGGRRCVKCMNSYKTRPHSVKPAPIPKPELQAVERGNEWWRADYEAGLARALAKQKANLEVIAAKAEQATYSRSDMKWLFVGEAA